MAGQKVLDSGANPKVGPLQFQTSNDPGWFDRASPRLFSGNDSQLENKLQTELDLARCEGGVRLHEILRLLVIGGVGCSVYVSRILRESGGFGSETVGGYGNALVVAVEEIERVGREFEPVTGAHVDFANQAQVGGGVIGSGESVAAITG